MAKKKTRKQKEQAQLRRQVEALKAELKVYKTDKEKPANKEARLVKKQTAKQGTKQEIKVNKSYIKKDLRRTLFASAVSLGALVVAYLFLDDLLQKVFHYNITS